MNLTRSVACPFCRRCFSDSVDDGKPVEQVSPDLANVVAYVICASCKAVRDAKVKKERDEARILWKASDYNEGIHWPEMR